MDIGIKELAVTSDGVFYNNINKTASVRKGRNASRDYSGVQAENTRKERLNLNIS